MRKCVLGFCFRLDNCKVNNLIRSIARSSVIYSSLAPTLGLQRREYWDEVNPLLAKWKNVNDTRCPECSRMIRVNMARHLRLVHSEYVCFWRCPVTSCSLWFTSELNAKDHIENIHRFHEGRGTSFYECLRTYGLEWFGSWSFFDGRRSANQALWMDLALARRSRQELRNHYVITKSPEFAPLRRFFSAAVDQLQIVYNSLLVTSAQPPSRSLIATMRATIEDCDDLSSEGSPMLLSPPHDVHPTACRRRHLVCRDRSSRYSCQPGSQIPRGREGPWEHQSHNHVPSRPSVPDLCIASSSLLLVIDPPVVSPLGRGHSFLAVDGSSPHPGRRGTRFCIDMHFCTGYSTSIWCSYFYVQ